MHLGLGFVSGRLRNLIVEVPAEAQNTYRRVCLKEIKTRTQPTMID